MCCTYYRVCRAELRAGHATTAKTACCCVHTHSVQVRLLLVCLQSELLCWQMNQFAVALVQVTSGGPVLGVVKSSGAAANAIFHGSLFVGLLGVASAVLL